jgi:transposase
MEGQPIVDSEGAMATGTKTEIRTDLFTAGELRQAAKGNLPALTIKRMLAIANALDGMTFTDAARAAGIERQSLGDAAKRYNAEGIDGLYDRRRSGRPCRLSDAQQSELAEIILEGPDPEVDGISAYTLDDLCEIAEVRFAASYGPRGMSAMIKRLGFSRQKARPHHPKKDEAAQAAFKGAR